MADKIEIYRQAFEVGRDAFARFPPTPSTEPSTKPEVRQREDQLDIVFYGMACFDPLDDRPGYRVLFPNGLADTALVPLHLAAVSIRDRVQPARAQWPWLALENDFVLGEERRTLQITGLKRTKFNDDDMNGRLTILRNIDENFTISENPDAVMSLIIDHGTLSAHFVNEQGMIAVRWQVQREKGQAVRFQFGNGTFIEVPPAATQVMLVNAGRHVEGDKRNHFRLFRRLTDTPDVDLRFQRPLTQPAPLGAIVLSEPTFEYGTPLEEGATVDFAELAVLDTPDVVCSSVQVRLRDTSTT